MSALSDILCVFLGGCFGAMLRGFLSARFDGNILESYPWGTFAANMAASLLLGIGMGAMLSPAVPRAFGMFFDVGFCAALSTFSSLAWQIAELLRNKFYARTLVYAFATFAFGLVLFLIPYLVFGVFMA